MLHVQKTCSSTPSQWEGIGCYINYRYGRLIVQCGNIEIKINGLGDKNDGDISLRQVNQTLAEFGIHFDFCDQFLEYPDGCGDCPMINTSNCRIIV